MLISKQDALRDIPMDRWSADAFRWSISGQSHAGRHGIVCRLQQMCDRDRLLRRPALPTG